MCRAVWACAPGLVDDRRPEMTAVLHDGAGLKSLAVSPLPGPLAVEGARLSAAFGSVGVIGAGLSGPGVPLTPARRRSGSKLGGPVVFFQFSVQGRSTDAQGPGRPW